MEVKVQQQRLTGAGGDLGRAFDYETLSILPLERDPLDVVSWGGAPPGSGGDWGALRPREVLCQGSDAAGSPSCSAGLCPLRPPRVDRVEGAGPPALVVNGGPGEDAPRGCSRCPPALGWVTRSGRPQLVPRGPCPPPLCREPAAPPFSSGITSPRGARRAFQSPP